MIGVSPLCPPPPQSAKNEDYKKQSFTLKTEANVLSWVCCQEKKNTLCLSDNCEILFSLEKAAFCILAKSCLSFLISAANTI